MTYKTFNYANGDVRLFLLLFEQILYYAKGHVPNLITIPRSAPEYMSPEDKYVSYTYDALGRCIATGGNLSVPKSYEHSLGTANCVKTIVSRN